MRAPTTRPIVVLDLDGTLLDCEPRQVALADALLQGAVGCSLDRRAFWCAKREGSSTAAALRSVGVSEALATELARAWVRAVEDDEWLRLDPVLPAALPAIARIRERGGEVVVLTARTRADAVVRQLGWLELAPLLAELVVVEPSRAAAAKAETLRALGAECFVGDTESDAAAAHHAGVPFGGVTNGQRSAGFLARWGADAGHPVALHEDVLQAVCALQEASQR